jgi:myo-inositol 2-dehydrogenase / D-chiro-inositol 1-dehydrogenase
MAPQRVNIGVVGLGRMGKRHVHTLLNRTSRANVVAVCSDTTHEVRWANGNQEYRDFGINVYSSYEEMLQHPGLQAIWVSTSTDVHARQTLGSIGKGLHVLCEKPLSVDLDEAQSVVDEANSHPELKVMAGFSRRFDESYRDAAAKVIKDKAIGDALQDSFLSGKVVRFNQQGIRVPDVGEKARL